MKELGILVPIVSPCTRDGHVDSEGLRAVCRDMVSAGCHGIFVAGSTGRGPWFSRVDQARICRTVADEVGSDMLLFAGCMASGLSGMLGNVRAMADAGAQIAVITAPGYFIYNQQEVETIFRKFADASPLPVMIYDIPDLAGIKLALEMTSRLAGHQNVIGIKDSSADMDRFREMSDVLSGSQDFYLLQGKEHLLAESLLLGASGFVVSLLHIDPRPFVSLYQAARGGDAEKARRLQGGITTVLRLVEDSFQRRPETSTLFHFLNCALRRRRVCDNILLDHEGDCPEWLADKARLAVAIFQGVSLMD